MNRSIKRFLAFAGAVMVFSTGAVFAQSADSGNASAASSAASATTKAKRASSDDDDWNGFYVGGFAGVGVRRATANTSTVYSGTGYFTTTSVPAINTSGRQTLNSTNFNGGGTFGYNHRDGDWVLGAEADFGAATGTTSATTTTTYPCCSPSTFTVAQSVKTRWMMTARPRVGYAWGKTMAYVTGGLALTDLNYTARFTDNFAAASEFGSSSKTKLGWTGGGGFETKVNDRWSVKGEYLYADFRRTTFTGSTLTTSGTPSSWPSNTFTHSISLREHLFRVGINYHF